MLRDMRAHPGRIAMTMAAIVLGVAFVVATWVVSDSAAATVGAAANRTDLAAVVVPGKHPYLSAEDRDRLAALTGVTRATGVTVGYVALLKPNGKLGSTYLAEQGGTSWDDSQRFVLTDGRGPATAGEVALAEQAAAEAGLSVGATAKLQDQAGSAYTATVVGTYAYRRTSTRETDPAVAFAPASAAARLGPGFARVELYGPNQQAIAAAATATGYGVTTAQELARGLEQEADEQAQVVRKFLLAFAGVALTAGMFIIANTFTMLVAQRVRHFGLLRAVGARRRQVRRAVLTEAVILGVIGATLGVALGCGLGWLAMTLLPGTGDVVVLVISPAAITVGYLVGVVVTVVGAYGAARRGAAVAPIAALSSDYALPRRSLAARAVAGAIALAASVGMVVATSGNALTDQKRLLGMAGALLGWLAVVVLAPLLASGVLVPLSRAIAARGNAVSRIAVRNAIRDPRRTAATASALVIGLAAVIAFATVGSSTKNYFSAAIRADIPAATLAVRTAQEGRPVPTELADDMRQAYGAGNVVAAIEATATLTHNGRPLQTILASVSSDALGKVVTPRMAAGTADLRSGVLIPQDLAALNGITVGDPITLVRDQGGKGSDAGISNGSGSSQPPPAQAPVQTRVSGIYAKSPIFYGVLISESVLAPVDGGWLPSIYIGGAAQPELDARFSGRPDVVVLNRPDMIAAQLGPIDLALGIIYALLSAAVIIGVFGVVNTLALSVLERTREIGVFRAIGATRRVVRRTVRRESILISTYGGVLGVGVGILLGGVMQHMILSQSITNLSTPWTVVAGALGGMVAVGVIAALWPARRAARTDVLQAIAAE
jgi:putative ABC transport system permease protein